MIKLNVYNFLAFFSLMLLISNISCNVRAAQGPPFSINLDQTEYYVNIARDESNTVNITGEVDVEGIKPHNDILIVNLSVQAGNWATNITPAIIAFSFNETQRSAVIQIQVQVPLETSGGFNQEVIVYGNATTQSTGKSIGTTKSSAIIKIKRYFNLSIEPIEATVNAKMTIDLSKPLIKVSAGDTILIELEIRNYGNTEDIFRIEVSNVEDLEEKDFRYFFSDRVKVLNRSGIWECRISIYTSEMTPSGNYEMEFRVKSEGSLEHGTSPVFNSTNITLVVDDDIEFSLGDECALIITGALIIIVITISILYWVIHHIRKKKRLRQE